MPTDEEIESKTHNAVVEELVIGKKRIIINVDDLGKAFITRKILEKIPKKSLPKGTKLCVKIKQNHQDDRLLVKKIISIDGKDYVPSKSNEKKIKPQTKVKPKERNKFKKIAKQVSLYRKFNYNNWQKNARYRILDYSVDPMLEIEDGKSFEGIFIQTPIWTEGFQGQVFCEEFESLIYVNINHGKISGSLVLGAEVSFTVVVVYDNRGEPSFQANTWASNRNRILQEPALSISHDDLEQEYDKIVNYLDSKVGPVVVVALRYFGSATKSKNKSLGKVLNEVKSLFTNYQVKRFEPFESHRHPFLKEMSYGGVVILPIRDKAPFSSEELSSFTVVRLKEICQENGLKKSGLKSEIIARILEKFSPEIQLSESEEERCIVGMTSVIHKQQIETRKGWMILGDETGKFFEFKGEISARKSRMLWVVIPPDCELPLLHPNFHGSDVELFGGDLEQALSDLSYHSDKVKTFIFSHEEGTMPESIKGIKTLRKSHLMMWQLTLPLVMEYVMSQTEVEESVSIYIERLDDGLDPGSRPLATIIQEFADSYDRRRNTKKVSFKDTRILAKHPIEHGWLAYTDALGHLLNEAMPEEMVESIEELKKSTFIMPYRQESLNLYIRRALKDLATPLELLKSISTIPSEDVRDYISPFLLDSITEARNSLKDSEWQELLEHFKNTAESIEGQHAANLILSGIDIDSILPKFRDETEQYIFLKSVLGSSNHIGTTKVANKCKAYIDDLLGSGLRLSKRETRKLKTLQAGANDNQFDWAHIIDDFDEEQDAIDWDEETQHFLGSQALSRALRNHENDLEIAWAIEEQLTSIRQNDFQYRRRYIYRSELLMQKHDFEEGKRCLEVDFPEKVRISDNESHLEDRYYLASLLKACALTSSTENFQEYSKYVSKSLDEKHPSQRIAYWYCRWANEIAQTESKTEGRIFEACLSHLLSLKSQQFFTKEAPGVILACELIDLNKRGLIEEEHESFLQNVLDNSEVFANEWVSNNPPNEDDWLAPLNFNYR